MTQTLPPPSELQPKPPVVEPEHQVETQEVVVEPRPGFFQRIGKFVMGVFHKEGDAKTKTRVGVGTMSGLTGLATTATLVASLVGGGAGEAPVKPTTTQGQEGTSGNGQGTTEQPPVEQPPVAEIPEKFDFGVTKADVQPLIEEVKNNPNAYLDRPIEQRAVVSQFYMQDLPAFAAEYAAASGRVDDQISANFDKPTEMSDKEVLQYLVYAKRTTYTPKSSVDNWSLDKDAAQAMNGGNFINAGGSSARYVFFNNYIDQVVASGGPAQGASSLGATHTLPFPIINSSERYTDGNNRSCIKYNVTEPNADGGSTFEINGCLVTSTAGTSSWTEL